MLSLLPKCMVAYGHVLFRYRNIIFPVVLLTLVILFVPQSLANNVQFDRWLDAAGIFIILLGQTLRAAVIGLAYIKRGGVNKQIYADQLVTTGMFALCRNPLYTGNLLILCGLLLVHNNPWVYLLGGAFFLFSYRCIVMAEEQYLHKKFGEEYRRYCCSVNRWIPSLQNLAATVKSMNFDWRRVLYKDYTTMLTWLLSLLLLLSYEELLNEGWQQSMADVLLNSAIAMLAAILALWVRISKKNGRLTRKPLF